jgi:hypothetical protein
MTSCNAWDVEIVFAENIETHRWIPARAVQELDVIASIRIFSWR